MSDLVPAVAVLAALSGVLALPYLYRLSSFVWLYFLRPSSIKSYLHGTAPYAIVTGATDGIGRATAAELLRNGFNLILHGRNEAKMQKVIAQLRADVPEKPSADIRYFIADASVSGHDFPKLLEPFKDLQVTLVFNNVGGSDVIPPRVDELSEEYLMGMINKNALFSFFCTRALLPQLRRAATSGPVHVFFTGSVAGDIAPPRLATYAASKGFLESLVRGLDNDERYFDKPTGVRFTYLAVGGVHSDNHEAPMPPSLVTPTSEKFAKHIVARVGCGRRRYAPYVVHAMQQWIVEALGDSVVDNASAEEMRGLIKRAQKAD